MRVIRRGEKPENRKAEWTCSRCVSVIESTVGDGEVVYEYDLQGRDYVLTQCPVCKTTNPVKLELFK